MGRNWSNIWSLFHTFTNSPRKHSFFVNYFQLHFVIASFRRVLFFFSAYYTVQNWLICICGFKIDDGYFVHFFAPDDLRPLSTHVVFALDVSGSMGGQKLSQLKQAMVQILTEMSPNDFFTLIPFSEIAQVNTWLWLWW